MTDTGTYPPQPTAQPGDAIDSITRTIGIADMVAYGGATWDWHRMHYDAEYVAAAGFPAPIVDGQMLGALMAECVQDWLGPQSRLTSLAFRFTTPVTAGQTVRCVGAVDSVTSDSIGFTLAVEILDEAGEKSAIAATGSAKAGLA